MTLVTDRIRIPEEEISFSFIRASGPGGQKVNKAATAVQLRFNVPGSPSLPESVRRRLVKLAGRRLSGEGILVIEAKRFRTRERNRQDALERLAALIGKASQVEKKRRPTRPTKAARKARLEEKRRRSRTKELRKKTGGGEGEP
jgi:ribosome-associated protein